MEYNRAYFSGKIAAVTGGASGIGLALCEELLESGAAKVVLADFNRENLSAHEKRLSAQYPGKVMGVLCNVTVEDEVKKMVAAAADFGGRRLDLLINCAGVSLTSKFVEEPYIPEPDNLLYKSVSVADNEAWRKGFDINFYSAVYGCRAALPIMLSQKSGQIVNIISGTVFAALAYQSMYMATKGRSERPNPGSQGGVRRLRHKNQFSDSRDYRDGDFQRKHHAAGSAVAAQLRAAHT